MSDIALEGPARIETCQKTALRLGLLTCLSLLAGIAAQADMPGSVVAIIPLAMLLLIVAETPQGAPRRTAALLLVLAAGGVLAVAVEPGAINVAISWLSLALLSYARRGGSLQDLLSVLAGFTGETLARPVRSLRALHRAKAAWPSGSGLNWRKAALPVMSVVAFTALFTISNDAFSELVARLFDVSFDPAWFWTAVVAAIVLQPMLAALTMNTMRDPSASILGGEAPTWHRDMFSVGPVIWTLVALNGVFLVQNLLDAHYLWSGALGSPGNGYAAYAQKGAYTLIFTVLLAAALVVLSLWPGSRTNASPAVRLLVYAWMLQNGFLLASCVVRLQSYIDAYGMTLLRIGSLIWMGLVASGLVLVAIRVITNRSNQWLVNANLILVFTVLWTCGFVDFNRVVASYNYHWSLRTKLRDIDYMFELGPSALPALHGMQLDYRKTLQPADFGSPLDMTMSEYSFALQRQLRARQNDWRSWTISAYFISGEDYVLPITPQFGMLPACKMGKAPVTGSSLSPGSSGTSSLAGDCPAPSSQAGPR